MHQNSNRLFTIQQQNINFLNCIKYLLLISLIFFHFPFKAQAALNAHQGIINAVNLSDRTIQINQQLFGLSDNLTVYSPEGDLSNQLGLAVGQKIEFWTISNKNLLPNINNYVEKINIITGYAIPFKK